jgi:chaperonin GroES
MYVNNPHISYEDAYINCNNKIKGGCKVAIKPIGDRVLVEPLDKEIEKVGSLYVPDTAKEKPQQGKIIAVGDGKRDGDKLIPLTLKPGDKILYGRYAGNEIKHDDKEYLIMSESDVLAILE